MRLSRAAILGVAVTLLLAAGATAAYSLGGRRSPAAANVPHAPEPVAVSLSITVDPEHVVHGSSVQVSGVIADADGVPLPGRTVEVVTARLDVPDRADVVATPMSDGRGNVAASFRPVSGTAVWLRFAGAAGLSEALSDAVAVSVARRVTVIARSARAGGAWRTTLRGTVRPGGAGQRVRLERRVGRSWQHVAATGLTQASTYTFTVRTTRPGTYRYRVVRAADRSYRDGVGTVDVRLVAQRPPAPPAGNGGPGRLLVSGDSFAYYLGQQLATARRPRTTAVESRHSSGLARPDYFDWNAFARRQVASVRPGAVVAFLGANDCQPIRIGGTGRWATLGSAAWASEYRRRAAELMRTYAGAGERSVYWIGLPIAQRADIAACYRTMNAATAAAARDVRGVTWVDSWATYAVHGRYSEYVGGVLARQEDGIHLTYAGTRFLTRKVYALLR